MSVLSKITITFNEDLVNTKELGIGVEELGVLVVDGWQWVSSRAASFEVTTGTPTGVVGETSAINFAAAFELDKNTTSQYTVIQTLNVVEITTINANNVFINGISASNITFTVSEDYELLRRNVRSPLYAIAPVNSGISTVTPTSVDIELRIWSGDITTDKPINANYTINKLPRYLGDVSFYADVSKQIRDFIDIDYSVSLGINYCVFTEIKYVTNYDGGVIKKTELYICFDGYNGYKEGLSPTLTDIMVDNRYISALSGVNLFIPFYTGVNDYTVSSRNGTTVIDTDSFIASEITNTNDAIFYTGLDIGGANNILVQDTTNITEFVIDLEEVTECIYTPIKCVFLNKKGVLQEMYFFKANKESIKTNNKTYKANTLTEDVVNNEAVLSYNTNKHLNRKYNTQANKSIECNTGYIDEDNNILIEQLLLSEYVWLVIDSVTYPVDNTTKSENYLTKRNDQLVKYTLKFDYSFDVLQNIR